MKLNISLNVSSNKQRSMAPRARRFKLTSNTVHHILLLRSSLSENNACWGQSIGFLTTDGSHTPPCFFFANTLRLFLHLCTGSVYDLHDSPARPPSFSFCLPLSLTAVVALLCLQPTHYLGMNSFIYHYMPLHRPCPELF